MITELNIEIEDLIEKEASNFEVSKVFKSYINAYVKTLDNKVKNTGAKDFYVKHTKQTDVFIIALYKYILRKYFASYLPMGSSIPISLVALGSYGREQLCIYSDIDLMILYEDIKAYNLKAIMEEFIILAWDCGIKLGSRVHELSEIEDSVKTDITIKSSIIESRLIYGSKHLWYSYQRILSRINNTNEKEFILAKNIEHKNRLEKYPLNMQPNIKDGYGGMRESNMLFWLTKTVYGVNSLKYLQNILYSEKEYFKYRTSLEFIFRIRNNLHIIQKKKLDIVNFDILPELSDKFGFKHKPRHTKERQLMAKLFECLHNIHFFSSIMCKKITRQIDFKSENTKILKEFRYKKNIYILDNKVFTSFNIKAVNLNTILKELISFPSSVKDFDESYVYYLSKTKLPPKQNKEHKKLIKTLLFKDNLYSIVNVIYKAGLFQVIFPITKKITNQPQFDGYHELPVDLHSILNLKYFENIKDDFVQEVYDSLDNTDKKLAKIASFFHDVGKGRKTDHHLAGERLFKNYAKFLDFEMSHVLIIAKLIRYHNQMSLYATNEDIYSEKVILNFTGLIQNKRFLSMLYIVTYADISAVGTNIYNSSTSSLLKALYIQSLPAFLNKELLSESARKIAKINAIKKLSLYNTLGSLMKRKISYISSSQIFLQLKAKDILDLAIKAKDVNNYIYKIENTEVLCIKIIKLKSLNLGYLLGKLEFLNISSMNIFKLYDEKKCFEIKFTEKVSEADLYYVDEIVKNSFDMKLKVKSTIPTIKENDILIDCNHTSYLASMKVKTKDQKGLLAFIAKTFDDFEIEIESAKLYTSRGKARDLFLIEKTDSFCSNTENIVKLLCQKN